MGRAYIVLEDIGPNQESYNLTTEIDFAPVEGMKFDLGNVPITCLIRNAVYRLDEGVWHIYLQPWGEFKKAVRSAADFDRAGWRPGR